MNAHVVKLFPSSGRGIKLAFLSRTSIIKFQGKPSQRGH